MTEFKFLFNIISIVENDTSRLIFINAVVLDIVQ